MTILKGLEIVVGLFGIVIFAAVLVGVLFGAMTRVADFISDL